MNNNIIKKLSIEDNIFIAKRALIDNIYRSANIEGVSITIADTQDIIENNNYKNLSNSEQEILISLKRGWDFILENLNRKLDIALIEDIHLVIGRPLSTLSINEIGQLRKSDDIYVRVWDGSRYYPSIPDKFIVCDKFDEINAINDPLDKALECFCFITKSQLFKDGNKRTAAFSANQILISSGYGLFSIPLDKKLMFEKLLTSYYVSDNINDETDLKDFLTDHCWYPDLSFRSKHDLDSKKRP